MEGSRAVKQDLVITYNKSKWANLHDRRIFRLPISKTALPICLTNVIKQGISFEKIILLADWHCSITIRYISTTDIAALLSSCPKVGGRHSY